MVEMTFSTWIGAAIISSMSLNVFGNSSRDTALKSGALRSVQLTMFSFGSAALDHSFVITPPDPRYFLY